MRLQPIFASLGAGALVACTNTPSPLTPGFRGSVGMPHLGVQTDAVELPRETASFERFRPVGSAYWGQPALVAAIGQAADAVRREWPGGEPLMIGDLSAREGGKVPRHNSHRSGRDVDLLWFLRSLDGRPIRTRGFLHVGEDGLTWDPYSGRYYALDLPRQWAVLKAFLKSDQVDIQWLFCSTPVEALLIDYARARGEPDALIWRAETVLLQPGDSLPHDDHIHLRIACTPETALSGCEGGGPHWPWLTPLPALHLSDADLQEIAQDDPLLVGGEDASELSSAYSSG